MGDGDDDIERIEIYLKDGTEMIWIAKDQHLMDLILDYIQTKIGGPDTMHA